MSAHCFGNSFRSACALLGGSSRRECGDGSQASGGTTFSGLVSRSLDPEHSRYAFKVRGRAFERPACGAPYISCRGASLVPGLNYV
jgi:hypothetical protein